MSSTLLKIICKNLIYAYILKYSLNKYKAQVLEPTLQIVHQYIVSSLYCE